MERARGPIIVIIIIIVVTRPPPPASLVLRREAHTVFLHLLSRTLTHTEERRGCSCTRARGTGRVTTGGALPSLHTLHPSPLLRGRLRHPPRARSKRAPCANHPTNQPPSRATALSRSISTRHRTTQTTLPPCLPLPTDPALHTQTRPPPISVTRFSRSHSSREERGREGGREKGRGTFLKGEFRGERIVVVSRFLDFSVQRG